MPPTPLHYLSADLPGIGGCIKKRQEDFLVHEQPLVEPTGEGEHVYLYVEKHGMNTHDVVRRLAKAYGVGRGEIGYAGLKDKRAITRQLLSIHQPDATHDQRALERASHHPSFNILWAKRHGRKLRRGHHGGNRFVIRIRDVDLTKLPAARAVLDFLTRNGAANYIGPQRFGYRQTSHLLGRMLLLEEYQEFLDLFLGKPIDCESPAVCAGREAYEQGDYAAALQVWPRNSRYERQALDALRQGKNASSAVNAIERSQRQFLLSALQSAVFNTVLDQRVAAGTLGKLLPGDLAWKHDSRAVFGVDQAIAAEENAPTGRASCLEVSPSGPMWGRKMTRAAGEIDQIELQALAHHQLTPEDVAGKGKITGAGSRRPLRIALVDPQIDTGSDQHSEFIRIAFELPRGAYATVVLREIMKNESDSV